MNNKLRTDILDVLEKSVDLAMRDPRICADYPPARGVNHVAISANKLRRLVNRMSRPLRSGRWEYDSTYVELRCLAQVNAQKIQAEQGNTREYYAELACFHACSSIHSLFGAANENWSSLADAVGFCGQVYLYSSLAEGKYADEVSTMNKVFRFQKNLFDSLQWKGPFQFP